MQAVPKGLPPDLVLMNPFFLDPQHGWITANDCTGARAVLFHTASGGRKWARMPISPSSCNAGAESVPTFVDARHGWLVRLEPTGTSASISRTTDGGKEWSGEQEFPWITGVRFVRPRYGWLAGPLDGTTGLFRTTTGGRTWTHVTAPLPSCCQKWWALFDAPTFFDDSDAVASVTLRRGYRSVVAFDATSDGGRTWHVVAMLPPGRGGANGFPSPAAVSTPTRTDWWVLTDSGHLRRTEDAGERWHSVAIPTGARAISIDAVDPRHAWIHVLERGQSSLLATGDGGRTWHVLDPVARPNHPPTSAAFHTVLPLPGPVTAIATGANGIISASYLPRPNGDRQVIVRFDPATDRVRRSRPIPGGRGPAGRVAAAGGSLWASAGPERDLYRLDARTLDVRERRSMPGPTGPLAAVSAGLWATVGRRIVLLDPRTGEAKTTVTFRGRVQLVAADPSGRRLYVSTTAPVRNDKTPIFELDGATGGILARAWQCCADLAGPSVLSSARDGVWVTAPMGMAASVTFLREGDLHQAALFSPGGSNGLTAYVARNVLWVTDDLGGYYCADPKTGAVLGYVGIKQSPSGISNIVSVGRRIYVGTFDGIARLRPSPECSRR
jgi:photosystem II stability/assembly factor-like uncharacterized protein